LTRDTGNRHLAGSHTDAQTLGDKAEEQSATRADELAAEGDHDGALTWRRIADAVRQLANMNTGRPLQLISRAGQAASPSIYSEPTKLRAFTTPSTDRSP
jgi:hypothetical protein